jgi:hypothetical protein
MRIGERSQMSDDDDETIKVWRNGNATPWQSLHDGRDVMVKLWLDRASAVFDQALPYAPHLIEVEQCAGPVGINGHHNSCLIQLSPGPLHCKSGRAHWGRHRQDNHHWRYTDSASLRAAPTSLVSTMIARET